MNEQVVIKFGGSLIEAAGRDAMLALAARAGAVVVPGGGRFADEVRRAQTEQGFSDEAAHAMAILAMDQTACALGESYPASPLCTTREEFATARARGLGAIWRPSPMALDAGLPASWDVTSDSLALWLAIELGARRLILLKAAEVDPAASLETLSRRGVVDAYMPGLARRFSGLIAVVGPATPSSFETALASSSSRHAA